MSPCETCRFYSSYTGTCDYIIITKRRRGCKFGQGCAKHEERKSIRRPDLQLPEGNPYWLYREIGSSASIANKVAKGKKLP